MSLEQNNDISLPAAYTGIPAGSQMVPYHPHPGHIIAYTPNSARIRPSSADPALKHGALFPQPYYTKTENLPENAEAAYNSNRHLVMPKMNQIGLLIDIYA